MVTYVGSSWNLCLTGCGAGWVLRLPRHATAGGWCSCLLLCSPQPNSIGARRRLWTLCVLTSFYLGQLNIYIYYYRACNILVRWDGMGEWWAQQMNHCFYAPMRWMLGGVKKNKDRAIGTWWLQKPGFTEKHPLKKTKTTFKTTAEGEKIVKCIPIVRRW